MSGTDKPQREWRFYIQDMIGFANKCQAYTAGMDQATFVASGITYDATLRNLELIGEAAVGCGTGRILGSVKRASRFH